MVDEVEELCRRVGHDPAALARQITSRIREAWPEYDVVPLDDHVAHVKEQLQRVLEALRAEREPDSADLERAAALGRLRA